MCHKYDTSLFEEATVEDSGYVIVHHYTSVSLFLEASVDDPMLYIYVCVSGCRSYNR
jgi:hypothetical protein